MSKALARLGLSATLALTACGAPGNVATPRDALNFLASSPPAAYLAEPYSADLRVQGGVQPYRAAVVSGALPPGVTVQGTRLVGTPTREGRFEATVEVRDAALSTRSQAVTITVTRLPDASFALAVPASEIRGATRLPLSISHPRAARAARYQLQLPEGLNVTAVAAADVPAALFWRQQGRMLTVDLGFRQVPQHGQRVALLTVQPAAPVATVAGAAGAGAGVRLTASAVHAYRIVDGEGKTLFERALPAPPAPAAAPAATPAGQPAPAPATAPPQSEAPAPAGPAAADEDGEAEEPGTEEPSETAPEGDDASEGEDAEADAAEADGDVPGTPGGQP